MYASTATRGVEIVYAVKELSRHLAAPTQGHMKQARRVLAYLACHPNLGPTYRRGPVELVGWSDADYIVDAST